MTAVMVAIGAALGAAGRWWLDRRIQSRVEGQYPWGTFTINVSGSLVLGVVLARSAAGQLSVGLTALLATGLCGGFTTFSTFGFEAVRLIQEGSRPTAAAYTVASALAGLAAVTAGWYVASAWIG